MCMSFDPTDNVTMNKCTTFGYYIEQPRNLTSSDEMSSSFVNTIVFVQAGICLFGIVGNSLSLIVLKTNKKLQTIPNLYIGHLALTDLLICLLIPVSVVQIFMKKTIHIDHRLCKAIGECSRCIKCQRVS